MKPKIIVVAYAMGRTGSSALMGSMQAMGCCVGNEASLLKPHAMNAKGFFELKAQKMFMEKYFQGVYPGITEPPSIERIDSIGAKYFKEYDLILQQEFDFYPIAVKSQRMMTLPLLHRLREKYTTKVVLLDRNLQDQSRSIKKIWDKAKKEHYSIEFIQQWLKRWSAFANEIEQFYAFEYLHVSFEQLIVEPVKICEAISEFSGLSIADEHSINQWIDVSLVHSSVQRDS